MNIVLVTYGCLRNLGNYENERIEATSAVAEGENEAEVLEDVKRWCEAQIDARRAKKEAEAEAQREEFRAENRLQRLQADIAAAQKRWHAIKAFLENTAIGVPQAWQEEDVPF